MEISATRVDYNSSGGRSPHGYVGALLTLKMGDYGSAVESIDIYVHHESARQTSEAFGFLFDRYHNEYLKKLPVVTFRRKLKRIEISFLSEKFTDDDKSDETIAPAKNNIAMAEVSNALLLITKRVKSSDDFDLDRFFADARHILSNPIDSCDEWQALGRQANEEFLARNAMQSPWDLLEVDWSQFHPKARYILDDPFFWDPLDDFSPNGNDTGAELLEEFQHWNGRNRSSSPAVFLDGMIAKWGVEPIEWTVTDEKTVRQLRADDSIRLELCNETAIALAFALLKVRGECPPEFAQMALAALTRKSIAAGDGSVDDTIKGTCADPIGQMRVKLESLRR